MCKLTPISCSVFLLTKKDARRKSELLEQPKLNKGTKSKLHFKKTFILFKLYFE